MLGLAFHNTRVEMLTFKKLKAKVAHMLNGWDVKLLSLAGKEVLIKVMALAIPEYPMACYKLSSCICKDINWILAKFW